MSSLVSTTRFTRSRLPHWEVEHGRYFVTVRCADSLPVNVVARLAEIHRSISAIEPSCAEFVRLQRQYFQTLEKYLDAGAGEVPLRDERAARLLADAFAQPEHPEVTIPHFTIMPNHWHALIAPVGESTVDLHGFMGRLKGRMARAINLALGRRGPLWQREWFDRWIRNDAEWERCVDYIHRNPVKAGIVRDWREHPWTR
jgi:putative transposase